MHFRLLDAYEWSLQEGVNPTDAAIAKKVGVQRETITRWRRGNPQLWNWVYENIGEAAVALKPLVDRRVAELAKSGSAEHQKLFYQFVAKVSPPEEADVVPGGVQVVQNFLVPRPEMPQGQPSTPALLPAIDLSKIPTVTVR